MTRLSAARGMRVLHKDVPATWWNGGVSLPPSNLDHVVAADHLEFTQFAQADVNVLGWPKKGLEAAGDNDEFTRASGRIRGRGIDGRNAKVL